MRYLMLLVGLTAFISTSTADPGALAEAKLQLQSAVNQGDPEGMLAARGAFLARLAEDPRCGECATWVAVASWRAIPLLAEKQAERARGVLREGLAAAEKSAKLSPRSGEPIAMKAALQGLSILFLPSAAMALGPEMEESYGRARTLSPSNPRVALLVGLHTLHKPTNVGGGPERARPLLERARALFEKDTVGGSAVDWGRDDAELWSGRCALMLGDSLRAREHYQKALTVNPANGWVRYVLLPVVANAGPRP